MRVFGLVLLLAGLAAAFGPGYFDFGLPAGELQPIGFMMIVVGGVMLVLGGRRRRQPTEGGKSPSKTSSIGYRQPEPEAEPEKRKPDITWGRGGDGD